MNPLYCATMALTALSLSAGDVEAKRRKTGLSPEPVPAVAVLTADELTHVLANIYNSRYSQLVTDGKRVQRDYQARLKNCIGDLMALDFCSKQRIGELEIAAAVPQRDLDEWTLDYSIICGLTPEKRKQLEPLARHYRTDCIAKRGKAHTTYCLEFGADIFEQGTELSAPPKSADEPAKTKT
ncbi:MAG TPA: hypothetical protein VJA23_00315 [Candidatus Nanoarchaeia archaeon]|nr:hypothetical protein [Candidatus Nanoarchaeia archaeon]